MKCVAFTKSYGQWKTGSKRLTNERNVLMSGVTSQKLVKTSKYLYQLNINLVLTECFLRSWARYFQSRFSYTCTVGFFHNLYLIHGRYRRQQWNLHCFLGVLCLPALSSLSTHRKLQSPLVILSKLLPVFLSNLHQAKR